MQTPEDFGGCSGVLNTGMILTTYLYFAVAFYGYLRFGDSLEGAITLSIPNQGIYLAIKPAYSFALFISYALQFYVAIRIALRFFTKLQFYKKNAVIVKWGEPTLRICLVFCTGICHR